MTKSMSPVAPKKRKELIAEIEILKQQLLEAETANIEKEQMLKFLLENVEKYRILLDESSDPIFMFAADGLYLYVNRAFAEGVNRKQDHIIGKRIWDVFPSEEADKRFAVVKWVFEHAQTRVIEVRVPRYDGDRYYITTVKPVLDDAGMVTTVICISKEITERKRMEDELRQISIHDPLTGLYNRLFFQTEMTRLQNSRLYPISMVMVDLDKLKTINDSLGHQVGDEYIKKAADVLRRTFRVEDIIARIGGDEFIVLLPETGADAVADMMQRLKSEIKNENDPLFGMAIGAATAEMGSLLAEVMRSADEQLYLAQALRGS